MEDLTLDYSDEMKNQYSKYFYDYMSTDICKGNNPTLDNDSIKPSVILFN